MSQECKTSSRKDISAFKNDPNVTVLMRDCNQARGIAQYAIDFLFNHEKLKRKGPAQSVWDRVSLFHADSVFCGLSALALRTNAPIVLREEALDYPVVKDQSNEKKLPFVGNGSYVFGSDKLVCAEKAILANCSAVREWDSNGTVFGFNDKVKGHQAGEFGHNDFYPACIAACQMRGYDGRMALRAMIASDEIRGRLAEVFSLKTYKIDHVVHGAIASAAVYGALMGATVSQIESAIGMVVAHYVPWRAIRAGKQLSDSKGASAAISTEVAIMCMHRAMRGFVGPADIFRNPQSLFRYFEPTENGESPFDLYLSHSGDDFAVMGMHFKLGLYEHQSAGALQAVVNLVCKFPDLFNEGPDAIGKIIITAYEPAFGIIGDPAKRDPKTRQSADHSMVFIVSRMLKKAFGLAEQKQLPKTLNNDALWKALMLTPHDYDPTAVFDKQTRSLMAKIEFKHGGEEYDSKYPDGIPTSLAVVTAKDQQELSSSFVMYPSGHARNTEADLNGILQHKFQLLGADTVGDWKKVAAQMKKLPELSNKELAGIYNCEIKFAKDAFKEE